MKKILSTLIKVVSFGLCYTILAIPQNFQQYTRTILNGKEKWTLNRDYITVFDEKEIQQQPDLKSLFHSEQNLSSNALFDERWSLLFPYPTDSWLLAAEADNDFIASSGITFLSISPPLVYSDLIISTDKGENWELQRFESNSLIVTMDKYEDILWLGGYYTDYNGFLLKSTNLGMTWEEKLSDDSFVVLYTNFFDENHGVVFTENIGSSSDIIKVFHTTDSGETWTSYSNSWPYTLSAFYTIYFANESFGWIADEYFPYSRIISTTDGGMNWQVQFEDTLDEFIMIHFSDKNHGWAAGESEISSSDSELRIYSTTNGGNNWFQQMTVYDDDYGSFGCNMSSLDSMNSWLAISNWPYLKVYKTTNGGTAWDSLSHLEYVDFQLGEIEFFSELEGWMVSAVGMIHYTSDGGVNWEPKHKSVTLAQLETLDFVDSQTGWAVGNGETYNTELIKTENGGDDWSVIYTDTVYEFADIDFLSDQLGFGISGDWLSHSLINKTVDGGISWDTINLGDVDLRSIMFSDTENGWSVGSINYNLFITHTSNSGVTWQQQPNINISGWGLNDIEFVNSENGFAVGSFGALIKTTDGGNSWNESWGNLDPNLFWSNVHLTGVFYPNLLNCWVTGQISGDRNIVAHTIDGGANWDTTSIPVDYFSKDIFFINDSDGYIVGQGYNYKTTDGGLNWTRIIYPSDILDMFFLNQALGWAVGYNGRIFRYTDPNIGVEDEKEIQPPNNFVLMQNYPNPFNPSTKIKFTISDFGFTILKIYDVLGNEITTLMNEEKNAGTYEVEWNATGLPSGVYFYQLKTDGFIETKKMILIK